MTEEQLKDVNKALYCLGIENVQNITITKYGATNGDIIKAMFPNYENRYDAEYEIITGHLDKTHRHNFDLDWWNAPYKRESEVKE